MRLLLLAAALLLCGCGDDKPTGTPYVLFHRENVTVIAPDIPTMSTQECVPCPTPPVPSCGDNECTDSQMPMRTGCYWEAGRDTVDRFLGGVSLQGYVSASATIDVEPNENLISASVYYVGNGGFESSNPNQFLADPAIDIYLRVVFGWASGQYSPGGEFTECPTPLMSATLNSFDIVGRR